MKKKILITGFSGFVSKYFLEYISTLNIAFDVIGITRNSINNIQYPNLNITVYQGDLKDQFFLVNLIDSSKPDYILHLASDSSVAYSWEKPLESFLNNTNIFLNLVEAIRITKTNCRLLSIGSSEEYGIVSENTLPLTEQHVLNPISPYAVARVSQEMLGKIYTEGYGLDIVFTRSFNHIGPKQDEKFVISSFVKQIVYKKNIDSDFVFKVGNINITRDFLDVRDVVKAYWSLLIKGKRGNVYNICSGKGISLKNVIDKILDETKVTFTYQISKELIRPSDNPIIIGCNKKIYEEITWKPEITIEQSLKDIINYWEKEIYKNENII